MLGHDVAFNQAGPGYVEARDPDLVPGCTVGVGLIMSWLPW